MFTPNQQARMNALKNIIRKKAPFSPTTPTAAKSARGLPVGTPLPQGAQPTQPPMILPAKGTKSSMGATPMQRGHPTKNLHDEDNLEDNLD